MNEAVAWSLSGQTAKRRVYEEYKVITISEHPDEFIRSLFGKKRTCNAVPGCQTVFQDKIATDVSEPAHCFYIKKREGLTRYSLSAYCRPFCLKWAFITSKQRYFRRRCPCAGKRFRVAPNWISSIFLISRGVNKAGEHGYKTRYKKTPGEVFRLVALKSDFTLRK